MSLKQTRQEKSSKDFQAELKKLLDNGGSLRTALKKARKIITFD